MSASSISVINPYTGEEIDRISCATHEDVYAVGEAAVEGFAECRILSCHHRFKILSDVAEQLRQRRSEFSQRIVLESGKAIRQARKEVDRCINTIVISAEEAKRHSGETIPFDAAEGSERRIGYFLNNPLGLIAAITPFNDPLNLVAHKIGPAIACGNSVLLKPSELAPFSGMELCKLVVAAGYPSQAIGVVTGNADTGAALVSLSQVRMVSFTGGIQAGAAIIKVGGIKKYAMDLGGNAPVIVLGDCDLQAAVANCVSGAFWAAGQNCIGTQRILIEDSIYNEFRDLFIAMTSSMVIGDPMDEATDMGPMISEASAVKAMSWVDQAIEQGARLLYGHQRDGALYAPTVLESVADTSNIVQQEVFAPIVSLMRVNHLDEAISIANKTESCLHAGIFTNDLKSALFAADRLDYSGVMINDSSDYRIDAMPFGGYKQGSLGREGVRFAMKEMSQSKVICFNQI